MIFHKDRAYSVMEKYHLEALVATTPPNVNYLSNYGALSYENIEGSYVFAIFFVDRNKEPVLIIPLVKVAELISTKSSSIRDIRTYGIFYITVPQGGKLSGWEAELGARFGNQREVDPFELLCDVLEEKNVLGQNIGIDERGFRGQEFERLRKVLGEKGVSSASEVFKEIRMVKTPDQVAILLEANRITEVGLKTVIESVRPGWTSPEAVRLYSKTVAELDALPFSPTITFGRDGYLPNSYFSSGQKLEKGDLIRLDVTCVYKNHYTDVGRNAVLHPATAEQRKLFEVVYRGEEETIMAARPGVAAAEIFRKGVEGARNAGMPGFQRVHCGHGIGLELYEHPTIAPGNDRIVEEGTVINVETPYYEIGKGAYIVEDTLLVTRSGADFLSRSDRQLIEIGA